MVQLFDGGFFFVVPTVLETWVAGRVMPTKSSLGGDGEETIKDKKWPVTTGCFPQLPTKPEQHTTPNFLPTWLPNALSPKYHQCPIPIPCERFYM